MKFKEGYFAKINPAYKGGKTWYPDEIREQIVRLEKAITSVSPIPYWEVRYVENGVAINISEDKLIPIEFATELEKIIWGVYDVE